MKSTRTSNIRFANKDVLDKDAFNPTETKFRVSMYIDLVVLQKVREAAKKRGLPYQTYINQCLRESHLDLETGNNKIIQLIKDEVDKAISERLRKKTG
jgi:predicted DNA binding CopG/RHH family protein